MTDEYVSGDIDSSVMWQLQDNCDFPDCNNPAKYILVIQTFPAGVACSFECEEHGGEAYRLFAEMHGGAPRTVGLKELGGDE